MGSDSASNSEMEDKSKVKFARIDPTEGATYDSRSGLFRPINTQNFNYRRVKGYRSLGDVFTENELIENELIENETIENYTELD